MTPIEFLLHHREQVLSSYTGSPGEAWKRLSETIGIAAAMKENTFRALVKNFVETCQFYERLNAGLNNEIERLNSRLNTIDENQGRNNMESAAVKCKLNIMGWTVAKSGRYFRAFKKIGGKLHGVHLGASIDGAEEKIRAKAASITGGQDTE